MSLEEAVSLVIQAGAYTTGRDLFVLDMGEPARIDDLARKMIRLQGLRVGQDVQIEYTGAPSRSPVAFLLDCGILTHRFTESLR